MRRFSATIYICLIPLQPKNGGQNNDRMRTTSSMNVRLVKMKYFPNTVKESILLPGIINYGCWLTESFRKLQLVTHFQRQIIYHLSRSESLSDRWATMEKPKPAGFTLNVRKPWESAESSATLTINLFFPFFNVKTKLKGCSCELLRFISLSKTTESALLMPVSSSAAIRDLKLKYVDQDKDSSALLQADVKEVSPAFRPSFPPIRSPCRPKSCLGVARFTGNYSEKQYGRSDRENTSLPSNDCRFRVFPNIPVDLTDTLKKLDH